MNERQPAITSVLASDGRTVRRASVAVFLVSLIVYAGTIDNDFVGFDDPILVTHHDLFSWGLTWRGAASAFATPVAGNWTPLAWLSHMLDVEMFGFWPGGHHLTSVVLHALAAAGLTAALAQKRPIIESLACGVIFAIHPVHVESVAWISERRDVLSLVFFVALLGLWLNDRARSSGRGQIACLVLLIGALWSKSTMVTAPAVLVLVDIFLLDRRREASLIFLVIGEKWPLWAACAIVAVFTAVAQQPSELARENLSFRLVGGLVAYGHYLQSYLYPHDLAALYTRPKTWPVAEVVAAAITIVGTLGAAGVAWRRSRSPLIPLGLLWFGGTLVPMIGILQVGLQAYADRYLYLPSIGLFFLFWGTLQGLSSRHPRSPIWLSALTTVWCIPLAALTIKQTEVWSSNDALWAHAVEVGHESRIALQTAGHVSMRKGEYEKALRYYRRALLHQAPAELALNIAFAEYKTGARDRGRRSFIAALDLGYDGPAPHYWLARINEEEGNLEGALVAYRLATRLGPDDPTPWFGLGRVAVLLGRNSIVAEADNALGELASKNPTVAAFSHAALAWHDERPDDARTRLDSLLAIHSNVVDAVVFRALLTAPDDEQHEKLVNQLRKLEGQSARWMVLVRLRNAEHTEPQGLRIDLIETAYRDLAWRQLVGDMASVGPEQHVTMEAVWRSRAVKMVLDDALSEVEPDGIDELSLH